MEPRNDSADHHASREAIGRSWPLAVGLLAALAYGAGVITTMVIGSPSHESLAAPVAAPGQAPVINTHRIVPGPNEY